MSLVAGVRRKAEREKKIPSFGAKLLASAVYRKFRSVSRVLREIHETSPDSLLSVRPISKTPSPIGVPFSTQSEHACILSIPSIPS